MGFTLTGSRLEHQKSSSIYHRLRFTERSRFTPIVYVVDPDDAERELLERFIRCQGWHPEIFASGEEFLAHPLEVVPGCLLLDISLPGLGGLELQERAAVEHPYIPAIFLSAKGDIPTVVRAMKTGAIVPKEAEKQAIQSRFATLSPRQQQVMALVSSGLLNKQVGRELGISEITVKAHRGQVMQKMQANSFADLIKMAARLGLARRKELPRFRRNSSATGPTRGLLDSHPAGLLETACPLRGKTK